MQYPEPIAKLIDSYMRLPGIGEKTAVRLAFFTIDTIAVCAETLPKAIRA